LHPRHSRAGGNLSIINAQLYKKPPHRFPYKMGMTPAAQPYTVKLSAAKFLRLIVCLVLPLNPPPQPHKLHTHKGGHCNILSLWRYCDELGALFAPRHSLRKRESITHKIYLVCSTSSSSCANSLEASSPYCSISL
jgi:hypothetical protein